MTDVLRPRYMDKPWRPGFEVNNEAVFVTVGECIDRSWQVRFACKNGHGGGWHASQIGAHFAREVVLDDIAERLVCKTCGAREGRLTIFNDVGEEQRRNIEEFNARQAPGET